jgi:ribosomal protein S20
MATAPISQPASIIRTLHARFEQANAEYDRTDAAQTALNRAGDKLDALRLNGALVENQAETDALRRALLLQVPDTWADALILQYHIWLEHDLQASQDEKPADNDQAALTIAMDTLFDFMACEVRADHAEIGQSFQNGCNLAHFKRRHRTGVVEG